MMNLQWYSDKGFADNGPHSKKLFTDHMVFYYMKGLCHLSCTLSHWGPVKKAITGSKKKGKGLKVYKVFYCYGSTKDSAFIQDPVFNFVTMLFPPVTKQDQAFI